MGYSGLTAALHVCLFPIYIKYDFSDTFNICISNLSKIIASIKVDLSICICNLKPIPQMLLDNFQFNQQIITRNYR